MRYFSQDPDGIALAVKRMTLTRSMIETSAADQDKDGTIKFRRGSNLVAFDSDGIITLSTSEIARNACSTRFSIIQGVFSSPPKATSRIEALAMANLILSHLESAQAALKNNELHRDIPAEVSLVFQMIQLAVEAAEYEGGNWITVELPCPFSSDHGIGILDVFDRFDPISEDVSRRVAKQLGPWVDVFAEPERIILRPAIFEVEVNWSSDVIQQMKALRQFGVTTDDLRFASSRVPG